MIRPLLRITGIGFFILFFSGCSYFNSNNHLSGDQYAHCQELKKRIIFNGSNNSLNFHGASNNQMSAAQQSAEMDTLQRSYREHGCE